MKTPENISPSEIQKKFDKAYTSYQTQTPKKVQDLSSMVVSSDTTRPLSKSDLAKLTDIRPQNIGKMLKGYGEPNGLNCSLQFLMKVALIFNVDMNWLCGLTSEPTVLFRHEGSMEISSKQKIELTENKIDKLIELGDELLKEMKDQRAATT